MKELKIYNELNEFLIKNKDEIYIHDFKMIVQDENVITCYIFHQKEVYTILTISVFSDEIYSTVFFHNKQNKPTGWFIENEKDIFECLKNIIKEKMKEV